MDARASKFGLKQGVILLAALLVAVLVYVHTDGLNGPQYWKWQYRFPPLPAAKVYLPMLLAALPILGAQFFNRKQASRTVTALGALMLGCFALKLSIALFRTVPPSLDLIVAVVEQPQMTSYYTDARSVRDQPLRKWISEYPQSMAGFNLHTQSKPPGPMLYWWLMIQLFGEDDESSRFGGVLLGLLATLSIPATYLMMRALLDDEPAAFAGASFMSLCPGFVLFFPMMDPVYPILTAGMIGTWYIALRDNRALAAVALGAVLAAMLLVNFSALVLGAFMVGLIFINRTPITSAIRLSAIALGTAAAGSFLLWLAVGYNPIATFLSAWRHQHELLHTYAAQRPYPMTIFFDLTDFALGAGWIGILLAVTSFIGSPTERRHRRLAVLAMSQLVLVAVTGLLQSETARVWNFMLPLLMIPVGLELSRWPLPARVACLTALALLTMVIHQNMQFLY